MDDNILFDNYHSKGVHVHYNPDNHKEWLKIKDFTMNELFLIFLDHVEENKKLNLKELLKELI